MSTDKYKAKKASIAKAAFRLFREKGYEATSVKDIADEAGIKKALVRYYFPKKEAFEDLFLNKALDLANGYLRERNLQELDDITRISLLGYIELYYISCHETMLKLGKDIVQSRAITHSIAKTLFGWIAANSQFSEEQQAQIQEGVVYAFGAVTEKIYFHMAEGTQFDVDKVFQAGIAVLNSTTGFNFPELDIHTILPQSWLEEKCRQMDQEFFEE